jgi:anthranilate 1,2-dioxygenase large subunit
VQKADNTVSVRWPAKFHEVPKEIFHREDVYRMELERIFRGPQWHMLAHVSELPAPGDFKTSHIGEMPVLIVHGDDQRIRVFENSCTHRGTQLKICARGHATELECPYHRWSFNTRGELMGAPGSADFPKEFRKIDYGLRELRSAQCCGVIFATSDSQAPELGEYLGEAKTYIGKALNGDGRLKLLGYQKVQFATNWKSYSDNEGYHGPLLHAAFRMLQFPKAEGVQFMTSYAHKVNSTDFGAVPNSGFLKDHTILEARDPKAVSQNTIVNLFPMYLLTRNLDVINLRFSFPRSAQLTEVHYAYFAHLDDDPELVRHRVRQASNLIGPSGFISLEDGAVFNRLQVGSHTSGNVVFQKGVKGRMTAPCVLDKGDEAGNLVRWERYREIMGFDRDRA